MLTNDLLATASRVPAGVIWMMAADSIEVMESRVQALLKECDEIEGRLTLDGKDEDISDADVAKIESNTGEIDKLKRKISALKKLDASKAGPGRKTTPEPLAPQDKPKPDLIGAKLRDPKWGFASIGDYAQAIAKAGSKEMPVVDPRLDAIRAAAASTYGSEGSGADGGYAVPPEMRTAIMQRVFGEASLLARTDQQVSSSNTMTFPMDMTTPWQTTGGIQFTWEGEAAALTQSKPALENVTMRLHKGSVLVPVTDELLEDASAMTGYLNRKVPEKIDFGVSYAIAWGNGVGKPLGFMNSPALVTQAAEGGQTVDTINATNIVKMWARMPSNSLATAVWLIHPDALPQLPLMSIANQPIFLPPGGFSAAPFGALLGRPVIPHQVCETVGDLGDILFVDLGQYMTINKAGGVRADTSIHLWFDQGITAFRFTLRIAGQPWWSGSIASRDGSFTQSPFVALAAR